jgi:hypothetical protein
MCFLIQLISSHIYVLFFKTCPFTTHIYILLALHQNLLNIEFSGGLRSYRNCRGSFHRRCPASGLDICDWLDMSDSWNGHVRVSGSQGI